HAKHVSDGDGWNTARERDHPLSCPADPEFGHATVDFKSNRDAQSGGDVRHVGQTFARTDDSILKAGVEWLVANYVVKLDQYHRNQHWAHERLRERLGEQLGDEGTNDRAGG